jgi:hypothetical protein
MTKLRAFTGTLLPVLLPLCGGCGSDTPAASANPWQGKMYLLDVPAKHWTKPPGGVADMIGDAVPKFLFEVKSASGSDIEVVLGASNVAKDAQDKCSPTTTLKGKVEFPAVTFGPDDVQLHITDYTELVWADAKAYGMTITNILPDGDPPAKDGILDAVVDVRELYTAFYSLTTKTPEQACNVVEKAGGGSCAACRDGEPYCFTMRAEQVVATEFTAITKLQPVKIDSLDPSCYPAEPSP